MCDHELKITSLENDIKELKQSIREYFYASDLCQTYEIFYFNDSEKTYLDFVTNDLKQNRADKARRDEIEKIVREVLKEKDLTTEQTPDNVKA